MPAPSPTGSHSGQRSASPAQARRRAPASAAGQARGAVRGQSCAAKRRKNGNGPTPTRTGLLEASASTKPRTPAWQDPRHHDRKQKARPALCALAHRLSAYRRRAHGAVQLAVSPAIRRHLPAADRGYRPRPLHPRGDRRRSWTGWNGWAWTGTARPSTSSRAPTATAKSPSSCWRTARPIAAMPRPKSWTRCAPQRAAGKAHPL